MAKERPRQDRQSTRRPRNSYRPDSEPQSTSRRPERPHRDDTYRPDQPRSNDTDRPDHDKRRDISRYEPSLSPVRSAVTKTKRERDNNPSTRIHSLKRQLQRQELPGKIRQERERELAALLFEQEKAKVKENATKNLKRYHFVRFLEKQKAERQLKQLMKQRISCKDDTRLSKSLDEQIHTTKVDMCYIKYAPLADKYISLYPKDTNGKKPKLPINQLEYALFNQEQRNEIQAEYDHAFNVASTATGVKPPLWYEVEKLMEQGEKQLEALRDGKLAVENKIKTDFAMVGGKEKAQARRTQKPEQDEAKPGWLEEDGTIDPADLDSDQDDEMGDGGFFER